MTVASTHSCGAYLSRGPGLLLNLAWRDYALEQAEPTGVDTWPIPPTRTRAHNPRDTTGGQSPFSSTSFPSPFNHFWDNPISRRIPAFDFRIDQLPPTLNFLLK